MKEALTLIEERAGHIDVTETLLMMIASRGALRTIEFLSKCPGNAI